MQSKLEWPLIIMERVPLKYIISLKDANIDGHSASGTSGFSKPRGRLLPVQGWPILLMLIHLQTLCVLMAGFSWLLLAVGFSPGLYPSLASLFPHESPVPLPQVWPLTQSCDTLCVLFLPCSSSWTVMRQFCATLLVSVSSGKSRDP